MSARVDNRKEHSKRIRAKWFKIMEANFIRLSEKCEARGFPGSRDFFFRIAEEHKRATYSRHD